MSANSTLQSVKLAFISLLAYKEILNKLLGNLIRLFLTPENISVAVEILSGDKGYGTSEIRNRIEASGATYCIPPKSDAVEPWDCDFRHVIE